MNTNTLNPDSVSRINKLKLSILRQPQTNQEWETLSHLSNSLTPISFRQLNIGDHFLHDKYLWKKQSGVTARRIHEGYYSPSIYFKWNDIVVSLQLNTVIGLPSEFLYSINDMSFEHKFSKYEGWFFTMDDPDKAQKNINFRSSNSRLPIEKKDNSHLTGVVPSKNNSSKDSSNEDAPKDTNYAYKNLTKGDLIYIDDRPCKVASILQQITTNTYTVILKPTNHKGYSDDN